jgi:hypothetical protein
MRSDPTAILFVILAVFKQLIRKLFRKFNFFVTKNWNSEIKNSQWKHVLWCNFDRHEHILRMATDKLPKVLLHYKPRGYRNIGRPTAGWEDSFSWNRKQACGLYLWSRRRRHFIFGYRAFAVSYKRLVRSGAQTLSIYWGNLPPKLIYSKFMSYVTFMVNIG